MLAHKQIEYRRIDLLPAIHKPLLRMLGFADTTVPALRIDGRRLQNSTAISRALEQLHAERPLFPGDSSRRALIEQTERWGEQVLQPLPRRLSWWALDRDRDALRSFAEGAHLRVPLGVAIRTAAPIIAIERRVNGATDVAVRADLTALPEMLDQVEELIADGTLGSSESNAADFQIATSLRLLMCFDDLRPLIERRPAGPYALRIVPDFPGRIRSVIPADWLRI